MVVVDDCFNQLDPLGHSNLRQEYQSGVGNSAKVDQLSEVFVHGDQNPVFCPRPFQQCPVAGVRAEGLCFNDIVSLGTQPLCQPPPGASVGKESHRPPTETGARVSPAITVCA